MVETFPRVFSLPGMKTVCLAILSAASFALAADPLPPPADVTRNLETLRSLAPALRDADRELANLREELKKTAADDAKAELGERIDAQRERVRQLRANFRTVAAGVEEGAYHSEAEAAATLDTEFKDLLKPLLSELREATSSPREMEELRDARRVWEERLALASAALTRVEATLAAAEDEEVKAELDGARKLWTSRRDEALSQTETLRRRIEEREAGTPTTIEAISGMFSRFWRSRGLNLLLAAGAAVGVFILFRKLYRVVRRYSPLHRKKGGGGLVARTADLSAAALAVIFAVTAALLAIYLRGDWLLLTLAVILLIGLLLASKQALPPYVGQIKTILNLGPVRQGERIVYDGVPWRVDALNMDCEFTNPELTGGTLRLPVLEVMKLHSRPSDPKEPWFPSRLDDWVRLDDGCYGKVIQQTPEQVVVLKLGGSLKTYPLPEYLELNPENLSRGFRVSVPFGIGYRHLSEATGTIPEALQERVLSGLTARFGREAVRSVKVEFGKASDSSLDLVVIADFDGEAASRLNVIERLIQRLCVEACRDEEWEIPYPQLVVHRPEDPA